MLLHAPIRESAQQTVGLAAKLHRVRRVSEAYSMNDVIVRAALQPPI